MTQKERELLFLDLCPRLPYGVKCYESNVEYTFDIIGTTSNNKEFVFSDGYERNLEQIKPYLRPMSSMTRDEVFEYISLKESIVACDDITYFFETYKSIDWLNKKMFDYRKDDEGKTMIEKGLALEAPEGMYETEKRKN